jgi:AraC-like DNA-binding protein
MTELAIHDLLDTQTVAIRDIACDGKCRHKSAEECPNSTYLVFPYRGVYMRHLGSNEAVAEANQVLFFNQAESYRISHPVQGGDACLSIGIREDILRELTPSDHLQDNAAVMFRKQRWHLDPRAQVLVALLRHTLLNKSIEVLEAETLTLTLVRRALGERATKITRATYGRQKLVDRAKLIVSSELSRRWTLTEIAAEVGVSPVYLTQAFAQVEGVPLYRYQLRLRLARALDLLGSYDDLSTLGVDLGFSSHSHFTAAFRQAYGRTPAQFQRSANLR